MARTVSLVRLVAVLVAAAALAGALPATRYAAFAQDALPQTEESTETGPLEEQGGEARPPEGESTTDAPAGDTGGTDLTDETDGGADGAGEGSPGEDRADEPPAGESGDGGEPSLSDNGSMDQQTTEEGTPQGQPEDGGTTDVGADASPVAGSQPAAAAQTDGEFVAAAVDVTISASDGTNPVGFGFYEIYQDAGGGALGALVGVVAGEPDGTTVITLDAGNYVLFVTEPPSGFLRPANVPFTVADQPVTVPVLFTAGANGTFQITKFAGSALPGNRLAGSCFTVYFDLDPDPNEVQLGPTVGQFCDPVGDQDPGHVITRFQAPGNYVAVETVVPAGFIGSPPIEFTVVSNETTVLDVVNQPDESFVPGEIVISKVDDAVPANTLTGACFTLFADEDPDVGEFSRGGQVTSEICDGDDGNDDGETTIGNLAAGQYVVRETTPPDGFQAADAEAIVTAGATTNLTIVNFPAPPESGFRLTKTFAGTPPPAGTACFTFYVDLAPEEGQIELGEELASACHQADGLVLDRNQEPGDYVAVETTTPAGYRTAAPIEFSIVGEDERVEIEVVNEVALPTDPAALVVNKTQFVPGTPGVELPGACFRLFEQLLGPDDPPLRGDPVGAQVCDADDGENDGFITLSALAGTYVLVETVVPTGFDFAVDRVVSLEAGQVTIVEVTNFPGTGLTSITLFKVDENGDGLGGACFELYASTFNGDQGELVLGPACSNDVDGFVFQDALEPGFYLLVETEAPDGYRPQDPFVFEHVADFNTVLLVENQPIVAPTQEPTATATATAAATATTAPAGPTPTTAVSELPSTGTGPAGGGGLLLLLVLLFLGIGATGWSLRVALVRRAA